MTKIRVRTGVVFITLLLLLALPMGALAKQGGDNNTGSNGHDNGQFTNQDLRGTYSFRLVPAKSFSADDPGDLGDIAGAPRQDILRVGVFTANGAGGITAGHTLATTDTNAVATMLIDFTWTGTYTVNPDGTGTLKINDPPLGAQTCTDTTAASPPGPCATDEEGAETYAIVLNRHGDDKTVELIQTDNVGGGAKIFMTGQAKRQSGD
jgi:hypothetical protein